ncbi:MAG TPA: hypothetical protein VF749_09015, partial [Candidatus Acidoferrum sp.]
PQSDLLLEVQLGGHFYRGQKGTLSLRFNRRVDLRGFALPANLLPRLVIGEACCALDGRPIRVD